MCPPHSTTTTASPAIMSLQTPRLISKRAKHVLAICTLPTARRRQPPKLISDTDVYTVIFSGTPADIFYSLARRCSTSDLFPTWALQTPRERAKLAKHVLAICTLPTARRRQPPKLISDTDVYTVVFLGHTSHWQPTCFIHLQGDIRRRTCSRPGRYSTSGLFATSTSCEACELRKTVPLRQCDPICAVQRRVCTDAWHDPICAAEALRTFATVPRVSENISRLPILGCLFVPAPARCTDGRRCRHLRSTRVSNTNI